MQENAVAVQTEEQPPENNQRVDLEPITVYAQAYLEEYGFSFDSLRAQGVFKRLGDIGGNIHVETARVEGELSKKMYRYLEGDSTRYEEDMGAILKVVADYVGESFKPAWFKFASYKFADGEYGVKDIPMGTRGAMFDAGGGGVGDGKVDKVVPESEQAPIKVDGLEDPELERKIEEKESPEKDGQSLDLQRLLEGNKAIDTAI